MQLRTQQLTAIPDFDRYSTDAAVEVERGDLDSASNWNGLRQHPACS